MKYIFFSTLTILIFTVLPVFCRAQSKQQDPEKRLRALYEKVFSFTETNADSALYYQKLLTQEAAEYDIPYWNAQALFVEGSVLLLMDEMDKAIELLDKAALDLMVIGARKEAALALDNLGQSHLKAGKHEAALRAFFQVIDVLSELEDKSSLARSYANLSNTYYIIGDTSSQTQYLNKALELLDGANQVKVTDELYIRSLYLQYLSSHKEYLLAKNEVLVMIDLCKAENQELNVYTLTLNLASYNNGLKLPEEAKKALLSVEYLAKEDIVGAYSASSFYTRLSATERLLKNYTSSIEYGQEALLLSQKAKSRRLIPTILKNLIKSCKNGAKPTLAYEYYDQLLAFKDSTSNAQKLEAIQKLEAKYQLSQKNEQIAAQEIVINQTKLRNTYVIVIAMVIITIITGALSILWKRNAKMAKSEIQYTLQVKELKENIRQLVRGNNQVIPNMANVSVENQLMQAIDREDPETKEQTRSLIQEIGNEKELNMFNPNLLHLLYSDFVQFLVKTYPNLNKTDTNVACMLLLNPSTKELSAAMSISLKGAERARKRLRDKLQLDSSIDLNEYIIKLQADVANVA